jgi:hypothetical protein
MKNKITAFFALLCVASTSYAAIIIDNSTSGLYNSGLGDIHAIDGPVGFLPGPNVSEGDPTTVLGSDPGLDFSLVAAFGTDWLGGDYSGGTWSGGPVAIPSTWTVNDETAIVYDFTLGSISDIHIDLGVDNGIIAWLDGTFLFGATASGGANLNEYDIDLSGVSAGNHSLQILRADHGGGTGYAILVDATDSVAVPEPSIIALFAAGLFGLGFARRRKA